MKLASKLVLLFLLSLALVVFVFSFLVVRQAHDLVMSEHERHAKDLAVSLLLALTEAPQPIAALDQKLSSWSQSMEHIEIRIVAIDSELEQRQPSVPRRFIRVTRKVTTYRFPDAAGNIRLYTYVPMELRASGEAGEPTSLSLEISATESYWSDRLSQSLYMAVIALTVVSAASSLAILLGGYWMVGKPLKAMVAKVHGIGDGSVTTPIRINRNDELGQLSEAINSMCLQLDAKQKAVEKQTSEKIAALEQLRHTDRLRTVGRLAAGIAHELGTPLNVVSGRAELISSGRLSEDEARESAVAIKSQTDRIANIVRQLLDFSRQQASTKESADLRQLVDSCRELLEPLASKRDVSLAWESGSEKESGECRAKVNFAQIQQVLTNLVVNAIQACEQGGEVRLGIQSQQQIHPETGLPLSVWAVRVRDTGSGIDAENLEHLFEPFFTTKEVGEGTGLGLSISNNIVHEHQGWIDVDSRLGEGATFTVYLPQE